MTKDEAFEKFKYHKSEVENIQNLKLKVLKTNHRGEYMDSKFMQFCDDNGI